MIEEKTKIASYVVMFSLHMCSFIFADFQDKPMGAVSVFTNRNLSTANMTCSVLCLSTYVRGGSIKLVSDLLLLA